VALVALVVCAMIGVGYWAWPKAKVSQASDYLFLFGRMAIVFVAGLLPIVAFVIEGRYCVYKHGVAYCRAQPTSVLDVAVLLSEPLIWIGGTFLALRGWAHRIADRDGVRE
jgi:hypothetical protein